ncbi:MAG: MCE family protein [Actinobacteria bacterium]|nr:MAG: MCE family protein [Actinomycetota bacterium]
MRRLAVLLVLGCAVAVLLLGSGAGGGRSYKVRAIFDNAFSVIPGEDVKIAGVKVGKIASLDITKCSGPRLPMECTSRDAQKAAVVLNITQPGFDDFRTDASCTIRPQSLIGEKFVECTPTQPPVAGAQPASALPVIPAGEPGAGQHLLPDTQTKLPVDLDLLGDVLRLPYRERLSIILNEFGTGLAGRGADLRNVIARADPALQATDQVLKILGDQNRVLEDLARQSDTDLAPLARERARVADFIGQANTTAQATAERSADLQRNLERFPPFLRQLRPTLARLGAFADQATPVLSDLHSQAPAISNFIRQLGPFSRASTPAIRGLGDASAVGRVALIKARPIIQDLRAFGSIGKPLAANLAALATSFHDTGGVERLMDYIFYQTTGVNGFDAFGHYLRAGLLVNLCSSYATTSAAGCAANFSKASPSSTRGGGATPALSRDQLALRRALRASRARRLRSLPRRGAPRSAAAAVGQAAGGGTPAPPPARGSGSTAAGRPTGGGTGGSSSTPGGGGGKSGSGTAQSPPSTGSSAGGGSPNSAMLSYLLDS